MKGMWRYAQAARRIAGEIRDSFYDAPGAAEELEASIATMTCAEWLAWRRDNEPDIAALASAAPSVRRRRRWKQPMHLLSLAAYQFSLQAALLIEASDLLGPGGSYRATLREAGMAGVRLSSELTLVELSGFDDELLWFADVNRNAS